MKKNIIIVLSVIITILSVLPALADEIDELKNDKDNIDEQINSINEEREEKEEIIEEQKEEADNLWDVQEENTEQMKELKNQLNYLREIIKKTNDTLAEYDRQIEKKTKQIQSAMKLVYEYSNKSIFGILFESKNLSDFFTKIELLKMVVKSNEDLLSEIETLKKDVEVKKKMQEEMGLQAENDIALLQKKINQTLLDRAEKFGIISDTREKIDYLKEREDELLRLSKELEEEIRRLQTIKNYKGGQMAWPLPCDKTVYSPFGMRLHPVYGDYRMHTGVDIGGPWNAAIVAANDGVVIYASVRGGYGNCVMIDHGGGIATLYAHCNSLLVKVGDKVTKGQTIAKVGSTGVSTGPHLHFEVRENGVCVDPMLYISK